MYVPFTAFSRDDGDRASNRDRLTSVRRIVYLVLGCAALTSIVLVAFVAGRFAHDHTRRGDDQVLMKYERAASRCLQHGGTAQTCNQYEQCMGDAHWGDSSD